MGREERMKLLVCGGAGFIGSNFIRRQLSANNVLEIVCLDKLTYAGNPDNLRDLEGNPRYSFVRGDICDREVVKDAPFAIPVTDRDVLSRVLFPEVYREFALHRVAYGDTSGLDTPTFFYGPSVGSRVAVDIEEGKTLIIRLISIGDVHADGTRPVVFELNGHAREVRVRDLEVAVAAHVRAKAEPGNWQEVGASMPGKVVKILAQAGETVPKGGDLLVTEAMKMETSVRSPRPAVVEEVLTQQGDAVEAGDLLMRLGPVPETEEV